MKYIKKFESQKYQENEIVVSVVDELPFLIKGHRYIVNRIDGNFIEINDIVNNQAGWVFNNKIISEIDYLYGEAIKKYNL